MSMFDWTNLPAPRAEDTRVNCKVAFSEETTDSNAEYELGGGRGFGRTYEQMKWAVRQGYQGESGIVVILPYTESFEIVFPNGARLRGVTIPQYIEMCNGGFENE